MAIIVDGENLSVPIFIDEYGYVDLATADFDPVTTLTDWKGALNDSRLGNYLKKGFLARADSDGILWAITLRQFKDAIKHPEGQDNATILATLVPEELSVSANQWLECRLIKVFAADSSEDVDLITDIQIGVKFNS